MIGQTLSHYRIVEKLGAGGMGEVFLAVDTALDRRVALKVLPADRAPDADSLRRFEREARILAKLDHPNIAAIYGFEVVEGRSLIAMQLAEGETLAARLDRSPGGRLTIETALGMAVQIAEALEAAHERGVVHRDLKPANVMVAPDDRIRLLDFGLGKIWEPPASEIDRSQLATLSDGATRTGMVLGTAAYMSPEQARGQEVDRRADVWAFGCVLFEILAGRRAFDGDTASDRIAAILSAEPPWEALPAELPARLRRLLERCLRKDLQRRLRDVGDARLEIEDLLAEPSGEPRAVGQAGRSGRRLDLSAMLTAMGAAAAAALVTWWLVTPGEAPGPPRRLSLALDHPLELTDIESQLNSLFALAPDGSTLAYLGREGAASQLYLLPLDARPPTRVPGSEGARAPFFSPDGAWLGFGSGDDLVVVPLAGGAPATIGKSFHRSRASWSPDGDILFSNQEGVFRTEIRGGDPVRVAAPGDGWLLKDPVSLPGGEGVLLTARGELLDEPSRVEVLTVATGERRVLVETGGTPAFVPSDSVRGGGYLLYAHAGVIYAAPFDVEKLELTGPAVAVVEDVLMRPNGDNAQYTLSSNGVLVYAHGEGLSELVWVEPSGRARSLSAEQRRFAMPRLSPDGSRVAIEIHEVPHQLWLLDVEKDLLSRFTYEGSNHNFAWFPDGRSILYTSDAGEGVELLWKRVDSPGEPVSVYSGYPEAWIVSLSSDGRYAAIHSQTGDRGTTSDELVERSDFDVFVLPLDGGAPPHPTGPPNPVATSRLSERDPWISPDGGCVAYTVRELGSSEVYVTCWQEGTRHQISVGGGGEPLWPSPGDRIYYRSGSRMMAVDVEREPEFRAGPPRLLFEGSFRSFTPANFDVTTDGRFVQLRAVIHGASARYLPIRLRWLEELERLARPR